MKVLLDEHLDHALRRLLAPHDVVTVAFMGWAGLKNGELLKAAEGGGIDVLLTGDQTLNHEQNLAGRRLAVVALSAIQLPIIRLGLPAVLAAIDQATPGSFAIVDCGSFSRKRSSAAIGLERGTVRVVDHDPGWFVAAARVCHEVRSHCGEFLVDIQHVGSTSVRGLPAKPVIDITAGVVSDCPIDFAQRLAGEGFQYRRDKSDAGGHLFVTESAPNVRTVHLYVVEHAGSQWRGYVSFRDILRKTSSIRKQYAELKCQLASEHSEDRTAYTSGKSAFIRMVLETQKPVEEEPSPGDDLS